jgi:hypothetical protein
MRRYTIYADRRGTWALVSSPGVCRWHIERLGLRNSRLKLSIEAFEESRSGRWLKAKLETAIDRAARDA